MKNIALSMIVYKEVEELDRCLSSIAPYVDGIYILQTAKNDKTSEVCKKYKAITKFDNSARIKIDKKQVKWLTKFLGWTPDGKQGDELFLFDVARNKALDMVSKEYKYFLWLDANDILRNGAKLHEISKTMEDNQATAAFMNYLYDVELDDKDEVKNILIQHQRERLVINDGRYKWVAPIHETLIAQTGEIRQLQANGIDIVHLSNREKKTNCIKRNIKVLEYSIYQTQGKDPRPIYYLAKAFFDLHTPDYSKKAENLMYAYLTGENKSGWSEERGQAWEYLGEIYRERGEYNKAIKAALNSLSESPKFPSIYLSLALSNLQKNELENALFWVQLAVKIPQPNTTLVTNPKDLVARALEVTYNVSIKQSKLDEAWAAIFKLHELFPNDKNIEDQFVFISGLREQRDLTKKYVELAKHLIRNNEKDKLLALTYAPPKEIENNPIVTDLIKSTRTPTIWSKKSVVIYCGPGWTIWSPKFLKEKQNTFIGGSEEAVIYASRELVKQGYSVTVYGDPGEEGIFDGVSYKHYFKFNHSDKFDILIGWRSIEFYNYKYNARKTYLWLHDCPNSFDFKKERLDNITKIMVLSKAQRELLPLVPEDKFFYTSNGFVEEHPDIKNDNIPTRCIWTSSYDRGLQHLLEMWPNVKKAVPKAELRIFYGWQLFDKVYSTNPERMAWKAKIVDLMKADGIYHGDRLTQGELEKEIKKAGVWAYPTDFYEINCISAIKAQVFGAVPVTMNYAALKETAQFGSKVDGSIWDKEIKEAFREQLIFRLMREDLNKEERPKMSRWAKHKYNWKKIINSWIKEEYETI